MDLYYERLFVASIYIIIYVYFLLMFIFQCINEKSVKISFGVTCLFSLVFAYMFANRDIDIASDTLVYREIYDQLDLSYLLSIGDYGFYGLMYIFKQFANFKFFLFLVALIYIGAAFLSFRRLLGDFVFIAFLVFLISPYFIQFGDNIIRNGMAASVFLLAISYENNPKKKICLMILSCFLHSSMVLMCLFYYIAKRLVSLKFYIIIWLFFLALSVLDVNMTSLVVFFLNYSNSSEAGSADNAGYQEFLIYGLPIVVMGLMTYKRMNDTNKHFVRLYMLGSCMQIMSLSYSVMAIRFAYFAGMLLPLVLSLTSFHVIKSKSVLLLILLALFSIKAYKIFMF